MEQDQMTHEICVMFADGSITTHASLRFHGDSVDGDDGHVRTDEEIYSRMLQRMYPDAVAINVTSLADLKDSPT